MPKPKRAESLLLCLTLPAAEISMLKFSKTEVEAVFERAKDGFYHSRDILFMSARNFVDDTQRDILSEYLQSEELREAFAKAFAKLPAGIWQDDMPMAEDIEVFLPWENEGLKHYNGGQSPYWLSGTSHVSRQPKYYQVVAHNGTPNHAIASLVCGVALVISIGKI